MNLRCSASLFASLLLAFPAFAGSPDPNVIGRPKPDQAISAKPIAIPLIPNLDHQQASTLPPLSSDVVKALNRLSLSDLAQTKGRFQIGLSRPLNQALVLDRNTAPAERWTTLGNGWRVWRMDIVSQGALGVRVHLQSVNLPKGAQIVAYNSANLTEKTAVVLPENVSKAKEVWLPTVFAERVTIECQAPPEVDVSSISLNIADVSHWYQLPSKSLLKAAAESCENDATCSSNWADQEASVALIEFVDAGQTYLCTGCLLATTNPNSTDDYFLTANHCVPDQTVATTLELYWFYQTRSCNGTAPSLSSAQRTGPGADMLAQSSTSDFTFLRLRESPPSGTVRLGWSTVAPTTGETLTVLHHPNGDFTRISFGRLSSSDSSFWAVRWFSGVTEPGSSGSPLFNSKKQLIGQLYGGTSDCQNPTGLDTFGRFDVTYKAIKAWIDPNPFVPVKGTYTGLFSEPGGALPQSSGSFALATTPTGAFSASALLGTVRYSARGKFDGTGNAQAVFRHGAAALGVQFTLDLTKETGQVTGTISNGTWTASLLGNRLVYDGRTSVASQAGQYTMVVPGSGDTSAMPGGNSFAAMAVGKSGAVRMTGILADGTHISQSAWLSAAGDWPLYLPLYGGRGLLFGWVHFGQPPQALSGTVTWTKPDLSKAKYYPGGFTLNAAASGSTYTPPAAGTTVLELNSTSLVLSGGDLLQPVAIPVTLLANNRVTGPLTNRVSIGFNAPSGFFSGRVLNPVTLKPILFSGVALQNTGVASGCFLDAGKSGSVSLGP